MKFLSHFGKTREGKLIVFDIFTFNDLFSLLLNEKFNHEDALNFILANCELSAYIFKSAFIIMRI
jgi:hypothetical protein